MEEICKKPSIRFSGFTDDWEQRKLGEHTKLITKGTTPKDKSGNGDINFIKVENITDGVIVPTSKTTTEEHENYLRRSRLKENDILFSIAGTLGRAAIVPEYILPANTNQALAIIRDFDFDTRYLLIYLEGKAVKDYIRKNPTVGAQPNLSLEQLGNLRISSPKIEEQIKIGLFFDYINNTITLHQRKLKKLESIKTTFLSKMFVSGDDRVPEYRFKGFTDDWEHRKLIESASVIGGNAWKSQDYTVNGEYLVVTISNVTGGEYIDDTRGNRINTENPGKFLLSKNDILVSLTGNVGRVSKATGCLAVLNQRVGKIKNNSSMDSVFLYYVLSNDTFENNMINAGQGAAQLNISNNDILNYSFASTLNYFEQNKIGILFENLDKTITLNRNKIEQLELLKKYLLKNMFV